MVTIKQVNKALAEAGFPNAELVKGEGYYYFDGDDTDGFFEQGVYVNFLNALSVTEWVSEFKDRYEAAHKYD
jgi:hypothetical protein